MTTGLDTSLTLFQKSQALARRMPRALWPFLAFVGLFLVGGLIRPSLLSPESLIGTATFAMILAIASFGQTVAIIQGGIDLSVANVVAFSALTFLTLSATWGPVPAFFAALLSGVLAGFVNGWVITKLQMTPIVTTIAVNAFLFGLILLWFKASELATVPPGLKEITAGQLTLAGLKVPGVLILGLVVMLVLQVVLSYTGFGRMLVVTGASYGTAFYAGVNVARTRITGWMLSGLLASFAGVVIVGFYGQASPTMGATYLLGSVAAVVVGGASIFGGSGSFVGTFAGALVLGQVATLVIVANLGTNLQQLLYGIIVLGVVALYGRRARRS
jgi:ribose transport system permease protein